MNETHDITVNGEVLSQFLGISERRIYQLVDGKVLPKVGPGQYELFVCLKAYFRYLRRLIKWYSGAYRGELAKQNRKTYFERLSCYEDMTGEVPEFMPFTEKELIELFPKDGGTKNE